MQFIYNTQRLTLKLLNESAAPMVLDFYNKNKAFFSPYEPLQSTEFYTIAYQEAALKADNLLFLRASSLRYYLFEKGNENHIIGTICFYHIYHLPYATCKIGYRLDKDSIKKGYAYEALSYLIPILFHELNIDRIEADILPSNTASIQFITKLGFTYEGISRNSCEIAGKRENHLRFSLLSNDPLPTFHLKVNR
ncbi:GNAT family N-acetyltransferase [Clostridium sp. Marseille-P299]|uniref:GNAT family N-acetyltransferase n=1 Tax=Clostridium sp. Marseille-P299 TaxID=1805477 RepID=UPI00082D2137|nr:GNAT family protein [Clostridium sp. Marseille-P299]